MGEFTLLPYVVAVPAYLVIGFTIFDAARRSDLVASRKALWIAVAAIVPILGTLLYLLNRPFDDPGRGPASMNARTTNLTALLEQREAGAIDDDAFALAKRRIFAGAPES